MACPCCLEMVCTVRIDHYLRVPGCLVPHVRTCTFWCCAKMYHLHLSTGKHEVALCLLAQLKRYKHRSSFCSLCLYLSVQGAVTCTRDDQAGAWNPCFISTHEFNVPPLHMEVGVRRGSTSGSSLCAVTHTGFTSNLQKIPPNTLCSPVVRGRAGVLLPRVSCISHHVKTLQTH